MVRLNRQSSPVPNRDQSGASAGTVLHAFEGRNTSAPDTATALITLDGTRAGLRVFYPENDPASEEGLAPPTLTPSAAPAPART